MSTNDAWKTPQGVPPRGASSNIQEEKEPQEEDGPHHLLRRWGGANDVDSMASSLRIDTREHPGRDLWGERFPGNSRTPFALHDFLQIF
jgi:hypothetical protein